MSVDRRRATDHDAIADARAAGNADLRGDPAMPPYADIVPDLNEIIDLGTFADDGIVHGTPVDRRVRADLHMVLQDDAADLNDLDHAAARTRRIAETVLPDTGTGMNDDIVADERAENRRAGRNRAIPADPHARTDHDAGGDARTGADLDPCPDHGRCLDVDAVFQPRRGVDERRRRNTALSAKVLDRTQRFGMENGTGKCEGCVWIFREQHRNMRRHDRRDTFVTDHGGRLRSRELVTISPLQHIADLIRASPISRSYGRNDPVTGRLVLQRSADALRQITQAEPVMRREKPVSIHGPDSRTVWHAVLDCRYQKFDEIPNLMFCTLS